MNLLNIIITVLLLLLFFDSIINFSKHYPDSKNKKKIIFLFIMTGIVLSLVFFIDNQVSTFMFIGLILAWVFSRKILIIKNKKE